MTRHVLEDFITDLTTATTVESARDLFTRTLEQLDVSHYAYLGLRFRGSGPRGRPFFITTYPTAWVQHYDRSDYLQVDPVLLEAPRCITPMEWGTSDHRQRVTARQRRFLDEAGDMGIRQGMAVPIHAAGGEFGLVSVVVDAPARAFRSLMHSHRHRLQLLSLYYHAHVAEHFIAEDRGTAALTARERECLQWSAAGKSSGEISETLRISESTVNFHLQNVLRKLGVHCRVHAIVKAVMLGLISPG